MGGVRQVVASAVTAATVGVGAPMALDSVRATATETGIREEALVAYVRAADRSPCGVKWQHLAAVGAVESGHGTHGGAQLGPDGKLSKPIESWAGAQGPMQFMATEDVPTWQGYERLGLTDGDGDGVSDINDVDDAAWAAANYLCRNGYDPTNPRESWGAYNGGPNWHGKSESEAYVVLAAAYAAELPDAHLDAAGAVQVDEQSMMMLSGGDAATSGPPTLAGRSEAAWSAMMSRWDQVGRTVDRPDTPMLRSLWEKADRFLTGRSEAPTTSTTAAERIDAPVGSGVNAGRVVSVYGIEVDESAASSLRSLLDAADADGVVLGGYGWRSFDEQVALRRQNCGTSDYAVWEMPSGDCSPPTAKPGHSNHEGGLAVDFTDAAGDFLDGSSPGFRWLSANAERFGWKNLPSEPWHWSHGPNAGH